jgi:purine-binding chemotaxis protein CheW
LTKLIEDDRVLLCRIRGGLCALPIGEVIETMRPLPSSPVAGAPGFVSGLAIIRGIAVPVVDAARLLADPTPDTGPGAPVRRYVTLRSGTRMVALAVEEVIGVRPISATAREALPPLLRNAAGEVIEALASLDAELLVVLRAARLLPPDLDWDAVAGAVPTQPLDAPTTALKGEPQ